jgi:hypothetical protein
MAPISVALLTEPLNATVKNKKVILHNSEELG